MDYPHLRQGQSLDVQIETGVLLPDAGSEGWYAVQKEPLEPQLHQVARASYAFAGQIDQAELSKDEDGMASATLHGALWRRAAAGAVCAGGRWTTARWHMGDALSGGLGRLHGLVEENFSTAVGTRIGVRSCGASADWC